MEKKIILLGERLLVTPDAIAEGYSDKIDLAKPENVKSAEKPQTGLVEMVSENCSFVRVGDKVHYNQWAGLEVEIDKVKYLVLTESEVMIITERA